MCHNFRPVELPNAERWRISNLCLERCSVCSQAAVPLTPYVSKFQARKAHLGQLIHCRRWHFQDCQKLRDVLLAEMDLDPYGCSRPLPHRRVDLRIQMPGDAG